MPWITALISILTTGAVLRPIIARIAVALGATLFSYAGMDILLAAVVAKITAAAGGAPPAALVFLNMCGVITALNIMWSGLVTSLTLRVGTSLGSLSKVRWGANTAASIFGGA